MTQTIPVAASVENRAAVLLNAHQDEIWRRTDRLFARLLICQWLACMALAVWRSPFTWLGSTRQIHPHVWAAIFVGAAIVALPLAMATLLPAKSITRHCIAASQLLMSGLLIHLGDGRIEMHFHVFGSLAFLAFYRDWRVLVTATIVVLVDHLARGFYLPQTVFGVVSPSIWRPFEHAAWVVFEDVFLITSCIQSAREMRGIAMNHALLEQSYQDVERKVVERTQQLKDAQENLVRAARSAGVAEIATTVLHNVGNVLNSVNVSANVASERLRKSELPTLGRIGKMLDEHQADLPRFLTQDQRGKMVPGFIGQLADCLDAEHRDLTSELKTLSIGVDHIKQIVAAQQSAAKRVNVNTAADPIRLMESALLMQGVMARTDITIVRKFESAPVSLIDQHKVLQILINLISNAAQSVGSNAKDRTVTLGVATENSDTLRLSVSDNGGGISPDHLDRIFQHGFTTKLNGHGFGLHRAANAAREMHGSLTASSDGIGLGATFVLRLPIVSESQEAKCTQ